ncbi:hypothetical protein TspCOW1_00130 [Thiohalobacter sp. COW1]|nr:hypothetical protein TspCOW1_00130 [Thiohalobacter sp. COW1]
MPAEAWTVALAAGRAASREGFGGEVMAAEHTSAPQAGKLGGGMSAAAAYFRRVRAGIAAADNSRFG